MTERDGQTDETDTSRTDETDTSLTDGTGTARSGGDGPVPSVPTSPLPFGWVPSLRRDETSDEEDAQPASEQRLAREAGRDDGWLSEGLATLLVVAGAVLFVIPEPATSMLGVALVAVGLVVFLFGRRANRG